MKTSRISILSSVFVCLTQKCLLIIVLVSVSCNNIKPKIEGKYSNSLTSLEFIGDKVVFRSLEYHSGDVEKIFTYTIEDGYVYINEGVTTERLQIIDQSTLEGSGIRFVKGREMTWEELGQSLTQNCFNDNRFSDEQKKEIFDCYLKKLKKMYKAPSQINFNSTAEMESLANLMEKCLPVKETEETAPAFIPPNVDEETEEETPPPPID